MPKPKSARYSPLLVNDLLYIATMIFSISCIEDLQNGITNKTEEYNSYLKVILNKTSNVVFNSGPYDNRYEIEYLYANKD